MGAYKYYNPSTQQWEIVKSKSIIKPDGSLEYTPDDIKNIEDDLVAHKADYVHQEEVHGLRVENNKLEFYTGTEWKIAGGGIPVGNVIGLTATQQAGNKIALTFDDPADRYLDDIKLAEWKGTKVIRKTGSYPTESSDGILILDNKTRGQYKTNPFVDQGLSNGVKYYYMLFPYTTDEVETIDGANRVSETAVTKLSQTAPAAPNVTNIKWDRATVTGVSGTEVRLGSGTWYDSPHTFTGLNANTRYYAYARYKETSTHYASPASSSRSFTTPVRAPGPATLIAGNMQAGFFGEVSASELISGDALASRVGISQGTSQNSTAGWLKFAWQNKILFVAKKPIRNSISWDAINTAKCVYGGAGDKTIAVDGLTYKVRLLKGALTDPSEYQNADRGAHGSEWNRLMLPIHQEAINKNWAYPDYVENDIPVWAHNLGTGTQSRYTDEDLLTHNSYGSGSYSWCQETRKGNTANRVYRGYGGVSSSLSSTSSNANSDYGWRPCLEFVS